MEELIKRVAEKAGISEEQARSAVNTVAEFLKEKVPPMYAGYIDKFMGGSGGQGEGSGGGIGSMFGF
jgi:hypothetical protein